MGTSKLRILVAVGACLWLLHAGCGKDEGDSNPPESTSGAGGQAAGGTNSSGSGGTNSSGSGGTNSSGSGGTSPAGSGGVAHQDAATDTSPGGQTAVGPPQVNISGGFSIDATEVTRDQYAKWLSTNPNPTSGQPAECAWNTSYTPTCEWPPATKTDWPVVCVDWCDARAFCEAAGRRLCGKIGGGHAAWDDFKTATADQWFDSCSSAGANLYPYGASYQPQACNGADVSNQGSWSVGSGQACQSSVPGFTGAMDLSGNVLEWEDSCQAYIYNGDYCRTRGGSFNTGSAGLRCDDGDGHFRDDKFDFVGFRCCSQ